MTKYMLDTNTCIALIKERPEFLRKKLAPVSVGRIVISSIVLAELWYGIAQSQRKKQNEEALSDFLNYIAVENWPGTAATEYGVLRAHLRKEGGTIGAMDLLIAAHALTEKAVLVTDNIKEFRRVPGLVVENWIKH